jgi:hypothetical protein
MLALTALSMSACETKPAPEAVRPEPFKLRDLAKTDVDEVAEVHQEEALRHLRELMVKLYRRNPAQWKRTGKPSLEFAVERVFRGNRVPNFVELNGARGADSINLAFGEDYEGDRILAFIAGLTTMIHAAYNDKTEFFVTDELDPQKLYNSARNVEIAAWQLGTKTDSSGRLFLLSDSISGEPRNLSFERLFGKIIAQQDTIARIVADRSNRTIRKVMQRMMGAVFLPI